MRSIVLCLLAASLLGGQTPRVAGIEFYGLRKIPESRLQAVLGVKPGDPLPPSKAVVEQRLEGVSGVSLARLEAVCCEADGVVLFVGIEEKGAPHFNFRIPPQSDAALPGELVDTYLRFLHQESARAEELRAYQEAFVKLAEENLAGLRAVVRNSADPEQRAIAAHVIGFAPDKRLVVDDLQYALQDPEDGVRENAMRSLTAIAVLAIKDPQSEIRISPTWPIEMLHSILWRDRTGAVKLLLTLTENRDARALEQIRERAQSSLAEMALWKSLSHALPAYDLLCRTAGMTDQQIAETWSNGEREATVAKIAGTKAPSK